MKTESEPRVRRSQRDYSLPFKVAVVGEVGRGELSYKQAQLAPAEPDGHLLPAPDL